LLDSSIWGPTAARLRAAGHDVSYVGDREADPGDSAILGEALRERRILVTLDKDFGEMAVRLGRLHAGIIRLERMRVAEQADVCLRVLERFASELLSGAIITARRNRVRIRLPEQEEA
jgi:predicted nuclease of predicted toxin-antitoxin system